MNTDKTDWQCGALSVLSAAAVDLVGTEDRVRLRVVGRDTLCGSMRGMRLAAHQRLLAGVLRMTVDFSQFEATLRPGEQIFVCVHIDGFFASKHDVALSSPHVGLSNQRFIVYAMRGMLKKRFEEAASWFLPEFTPRINSSEGSALGPFLYVLTLFTDAGETVSAASTLRVNGTSSKGW